MQHGKSSAPIGSRRRTEPDLDDPAWQAWRQTHRVALSYEAGLDIEAALLDWLTVHVRFIDPEERTPC